MVALVMVVANPVRGRAQNAVDPVADATGAAVEGSIHQPLPEQYVWTAGTGPFKDGHKVRLSINQQIEPHYFRTTFDVGSVPTKATLYVAGPRSVQLYVNGQMALEEQNDLTQPIGMRVFTVPVESLLKAGKNTLAMKVVRGRGVNHSTNSPITVQQTLGEVLVAKIVPGGPGVFAEPLVMSGPGWKSVMNAAPGWEQVGFDDHRWNEVESLGAIESSIDMFQWNADAGLYDWPGYDGISPFLAHRSFPIHEVMSSTQGRSHFENLEALTHAGSGKEFGVYLSGTSLQAQNAPSIVVDFGRETTGRVELISDSNETARVSLQYGESYEEMAKSPYLGVNLLDIAPHQAGFGPKSSFRYAKISFVGGGPDLHFKSIDVDAIFYPVKYQGAFESSDPVLNRIWQTGAYTAHLCMQDDIWDSPKRDRGRWMGDTDVMGRTIEDVFDDHFLMEDTLDRLLGPAPVDKDVNGIPGYSAAWLTGLAQYYRQTGSKEFLRKEHDRMVELLAYVDKQFDDHSTFANKAKVWLFVDWSPELNGDTPESRRATTMEFYQAYRDAGWMLRELGDTANAEHYEQRAVGIKAGAQKYLLDASTGGFGTRWQTNAAAVLYDVADPTQYDAIWKGSLSSVGHVRYNGYAVTPYYNYYVISAMAKMGHREEALSWLRAYWGGMLAEGATSYWEAYDPDWFKSDFHSSLQADGRSGYFVSLAHGWSSGATPWLMEQVLGIQSRGAGFSEVSLRPDLLGLQWARGAEPTPQGLLKVEMKSEGLGGMALTVDLPAGVKARVAVPVSHAGAGVQVNGHPVTSTAAEAGTRAIVVLDEAGHYTFSN
ncbi:MAG: alpha-L-rhamnosidase C-terminal domain-containing protein [Acidobacteriota bacterium]